MAESDVVGVVGVDCEFEFCVGVDCEFEFCVGVDCEFEFCVGVDCEFEFWNQFLLYPITAAEEVTIIIMSSIAASLVFFI